MDPVHERGSMDPVHESSPWTRSKVGVHGPLVHVLSSPDFFYRKLIKIKDYLLQKTYFHPSTSYIIGHTHDIWDV